METETVVHCRKLQATCFWGQGVFEMSFYDGWHCLHLPNPDRVISMVLLSTRTRLGAEWVCTSRAKNQRKKHGTERFTGYDRIKDMNSLYPLAVLLFQLWWDFNHEIWRNVLEKFCESANLMNFRPRFTFLFWYRHSYGLDRIAIRPFVDFVMVGVCANWYSSATPLSVLEVSCLLKVPCFSSLPPWSRQSLWRFAFE